MRVRDALIFRTGEIAIASGEDGSLADRMVGLWLVLHCCRHFAREDRRGGSGQSGGTRN